MSKIALSGNASGTGTLTIAAPNTNSNYTLTIPGETGTLLTSASSPTLSNLTLSGGVYLGGTGSANYLDDYEEGTWTPTAEGSSTAGSATYITQFGAYTKIGSLVALNFYIGYSGGTGTGNLVIKGIPFNFTNQADYGSTGSVMTFNLNWDTGTSPVLFGGANYNYLRVYTSGDNIVWDNQSYDDDAYITGSIMYHTN